jgi:hypothetical protein
VGNVGLGEGRGAKTKSTGKCCTVESRDSVYLGRSSFLVASSRYLRSPDRFRPSRPLSTRRFHNPNPYTYRMSYFIRRSQRVLYHLIYTLHP